MIQQYVLRVVLAGTLAAALLPGRLATAADAEHAWRGYCGPVSGFGEKGQVGTEGNKQPSVAQFRLSTFSADVTCPVGHPLLGGLYAAAEKIVDPLQARGFVLLGPDEPIVRSVISPMTCGETSWPKQRGLGGSGFLSVRFTSTMLR